MFSSECVYISHLVQWSFLKCTCIIIRFLGDPIQQSGHALKGKNAIIRSFLLLALTHFSMVREIDVFLSAFVVQSFSATDRYELLVDWPSVLSSMANVSRCSWPQFSCNVTILPQGMPNIVVLESTPPQLREYMNWIWNYLGLCTYILSA